MTTLYSWTTTNGDYLHSDVPPAQTDASVVELILNRSVRYMAQHTIRKHESIPEHEYIMTALPNNLQILRMDSCRIRTFPSLPLSIHELYASFNDFLSVPDLSIYPELIVLELNDGRLDRFETTLPPALARCNLNSNALININIPGEPPILLDVTAYNNPRVKVNASASGFVFVGHLMDITIRRAGVVLPRPIVNIAAQPQNVHDTGVQKSTHKNIDYIHKWGKQYPVLRNDKLITSMKAEFEKHSVSKRSVSWFSRIICSLNITSISSNVALIYQVRERLVSAYTMSGVSMASLIERLWCRIMHLPEELKASAIQRMKEEIKESTGMCSNGFMVRMANVLIGIDENVVLRLETNQIMGTRIPLTMKNMRKKGGWKEGEEPWEWSRDCFLETIKDLDDCDEKDYERRKPWLEPFFEGFAEELVKMEDGFPTINYKSPTDVDKFVDMFVIGRFKTFNIPMTEYWAVSQVKFELKTKLMKKYDSSEPSEKPNDAESSNESVNALEDTTIHTTPSNESVNALEDTNVRTEPPSYTEFIENVDLQGPMGKDVESYDATRFIYGIVRL